MAVGEVILLWMKCIAIICRKLFCPSRLTGEWHSVAILDSVEHRFLAIPIPTRDGSWGASWRVPWEEWRDYDSINSVWKSIDGVRKKVTIAKKNSNSPIIVLRSRWYKNKIKTGQAFFIQSRYGSRSVSDTKAMVDEDTHRYSFKSSAYFSLYSIRDALLLMVMYFRLWRRWVSGLNWSFVGTTVNDRNASMNGNRTVILFLNNVCTGRFWKTPWS